MRLKPTLCRSPVRDGRCRARRGRGWRAIEPRADVCSGGLEHLVGGSDLDSAVCSHGDIRLHGLADVLPENAVCACRVNATVDEILLEFADQRLVVENVGEVRILNKICVGFLEVNGIAFDHGGDGPFTLLDLVCRERLVDAARQGLLERFCCLFGGAELDLLDGLAVRVVALVWGMIVVAMIVILISRGLVRQGVVGRTRRGAC